MAGALHWALIPRPTDSWSLKFLILNKWARKILKSMDALRNLMKLKLVGPVCMDDGHSMGSREPLDSADGHWCLLCQQAWALYAYPLVVQDIFLCQDV